MPTDSQLWILGDEPTTFSPLRGHFPHPRKKGVLADEEILGKFQNWVWT